MTVYFNIIQFDDFDEISHEYEFNTNSTIFEIPEWVNKSYKSDNHAIFDYEDNFMNIYDIIADSLNHNRLKKLDLSFYDFEHNKEKGFENIIESIKHNVSLKTLIFPKNMNYDDVNNMLDSFKINQSITSINLLNNNFDLNKLIELLKINKNIQELSIFNYNFNIFSECKQELISVLKNMKILDLYRCYINIEDLIILIQDNNVLESLYLTNINLEDINNDYTTNDFNNFVFLLNNLKSLKNFYVTKYGENVENDRYFNFNGCNMDEVDVICEINNYDYYDNKYYKIINEENEE